MIESQQFGCVKVSGQRGLRDEQYRFNGETRHRPKPFSEAWAMCLRCNEHHWFAAVPFARSWAKSHSAEVHGLLSRPLKASRDLGHDWRETVKVDSDDSERTS